METTKDYSFIYNRVLYGLFVFLMIFYVLIKQEYLDAASALGIALLFDPFNQKTPWNERPIWQKMWLIVHLLLVLVLFIVGVSIS